MIEIPTFVKDKGGNTLALIESPSGPVRGTLKAIQSDGTATIDHGGMDRTGALTGRRTAGEVEAILAGLSRG